MHDTPPVHVCSGDGDRQFVDDVPVSQKLSCVEAARDAGVIVDHCTRYPAGATTRRRQFEEGSASEYDAGIVIVMAFVPTESEFTFVYGASKKTIEPAVVGAEADWVYENAGPPKDVEKENVDVHGVTTFVPNVST